VIHSSKRLWAWLGEHGERIRLRFLPPYCPDDNRIERCVRRELHTNVTYHHTCETIEALVHEAIVFLMRRNRSRHPPGAESWQGIESQLIRRRTGVKCCECSHEFYAFRRLFSRIV